MSVTLLAQKGKMGDNTYYITTMKANTLIKTVGIEDFLAKTITDNFINNKDTFINKEYLC